MKIGIIGGGVSGLVSALRIAKSTNNKPMVHILQSSNRLGGRMFVHSLIKHGICYKLDLGANIIDFNEEQLVQWKHIMPVQMRQKLRPLTRPFLIYEHKNGKIMEGDLQKHAKYYYEGGFQQLIQDIVVQLKKEQVKIDLNKKVQQILQNQQNQKQLKVLTSDQMQQYYNKVILAIPSPFINQIVDQNIKENIKGYYHNLKKSANSIKYTKQISVAFISPSTQPHPFSCILFKGHPAVTFVCSHQQKYGQNSMVVQLTEEFTQKYMQLSQQCIHQAVYDSLCQTLPVQISQHISKQFVYIKKWDISLVIPKQELIWKNIANEKVQAVGDWTQGKSRVTGAIASITNLGNL